jgi:citrate lyase subunit beta / citryl-CoA lyase
MTRILDFISPLFVPGHRPERFEKAVASGADAIIIDLEDAVPPEAKPFARSELRVDFTDLPVLLRINGAATPWHEEDLAAAVCYPFAGIVFPKAELGHGFDECHSTCNIDPVCTENLIRVDDVMESLKLAE